MSMFSIIRLFDDKQYMATGFTLHWENVQTNRYPFSSVYKKVQVGKDQEKAQSEKRFPLQKPRLEKTKLTVRYLYHENISQAE